MSSIIYTDHPVCQLMAEKAMHDPKYRLQLERSASNKETLRSVAIEDDVTKFRNRLLMLHKLEDETCQHRRKSPNAIYNEKTNYEVMPWVSLLGRWLVVLIHDTNIAATRGKLLQILVEL